MIFNLRIILTYLNYNLIANKIHILFKFLLIKRVATIMNTIKKNKYCLFNYIYGIYIYKIINLISPFLNFAFIYSFYCLF